jgi:hypothetical protein
MIDLVLAVAFTGIFILKELLFHSSEEITHRYRSFRAMPRALWLGKWCFRPLRGRSKSLLAFASLQGGI